MAEENATEMVRNITICLVAAATAGVLITIYHCISSNSVHNILNLRRRATTNSHLHHHQHQTASLSRQDHPRSIETSIAQLIPSYKYQKKVDNDDNDNKGVVESDDGMCPVCLSDFEDGEDVRTLPDCLHSFHAPCIDMWLFSHSNCPMCRTIATPSPRMLLHLINSNPDAPPIAANMHNHYISPIDRLV